MESRMDLKSIYMPSEDVVARDVQGEFIIIPITNGIGDLEDEIFTLNETGKAVWDSLDGKKTLQDVIESLESEFEAVEGEIGKDVLGISAELLRRKMLVEAK
ncbi:MAG: PqqD family protein [Candidatus Omnitrophica bacterium]|nr:PqqD family protein [Candidatus Omnitrophota bacterium]MBU4418634.1 PqqD family protein [Candidatus Omnitrophota bacterium]MBU4467885.1 PqqD family protein [Candidatus Omnitrophota bacterium]MCG2708152.1 PqqD family protein [Candidatus Omnitrophota bacterium]